MPVKAIGLLSGGLDSTLAVRVLQDQHIQILGVSFQTPFFGPYRAQQAAEHLNIPLRIIDLTEEYLRMLRHPKHGYGKNMNPCIDCHAMMFRYAGRIMEEEGFDFLFSGEVLGERPMSQNRQSLNIVARESGYPDDILRPLSAKLLPETASEREGKVDRSRLLDIQGRSRTRQMELAARYGLHEVPSPGGGCRLTEPTFARRLRDLFNHQEEVPIRDIELLKLGRHLRLNDRTKIIVGRNEKENDQLEAWKKPDDLVLQAEDIPGPLVLIPHGASEEDIHEAAAICARYSDAPPDVEVYVRCTQGADQQQILTKACSNEATRDLMI